MCNILSQYKPSFKSSSSSPCVLPTQMTGNLYRVLSREMQRQPTRAVMRESMVHRMASYPEDTSAKSPPAAVASPPFSAFFVVWLWRTGNDNESFPRFSVSCNQFGDRPDYGFQPPYSSIHFLVFDDFIQIPFHGRREFYSIKPAVLTALLIAENVAGDFIYAVFAVVKVGRFNLLRTQYAVEITMSGIMLTVSFRECVVVL